MTGGTSETLEKTVPVFFELTNCGGFALKEPIKPAASECEGYLEFDKTETNVLTCYSVSECECEVVSVANVGFSG